MWVEEDGRDEEDLRSHVEWDTMRHRACLVLHCRKLPDSGGLEDSRSFAAVYGRQRFLALHEGVAADVSTQKVDSHEIARVGFIYLRFEAICAN